MGFLDRIRTLLREAKFRRLIAVRSITQTADGTLQVSVASYVLFSPENQTNVWAIAAVLAITLLPFSFIAPFVSVFLDRWSRRQVVVVCDSSRAVICLAMAGLLTTGSHSVGVQLIIFLLLLIANGLNRFLLAGLNAGLPHTINKTEYLTANSVLPLLGPLGLMLGVVIAFSLRLGLSHVLPTYLTDAIGIGVACLGFCGSVILASCTDKWAWGPKLADKLFQTRSSMFQTFRQVIGDLRAGFSHIQSRAHLKLAMILIGVQRILFGLISVAMILATRNIFHTAGEANAALVDMGLWSGATGVGYILAPLVLNPLSAKFKVRNSLVIFLIFAGIVQLAPGLWFSLLPQVCAGFGIGLASQGVRILSDTLVQTHCDNTYKGRVWIIYDVIYNAAFAFSGVVAGFVMKPVGLSAGLIVGLAIGYFLLAGGIWLASRRLGQSSFDKGTHLQQS